MKTTTHKLLLALSVAAALSFVSRASANLVNNGGFETGDFTGWTQSGDTSFTGVSNGTSNSGDYSAFFGPVETLGFISQDISTTAGSLYDLSFFLAQGSSGGERPGIVPPGFFGDPPKGSISNEFQVFWNGTMIFDGIDFPDQPFTESMFTGLMATGSTTELRFAFFNSPSYFYLDDVSVDAQTTAVPEGLSTLWLALPFFGLIGYTQLRRRKV
jgi:hypothetical protein